MESSVLLKYSHNFSSRSGPVPFVFNRLSALTSLVISRVVVFFPAEIKLIRSTPGCQQGDLLFHPTGFIFFLDHNDAQQAHLTEGYHLR